MQTGHLLQCDNNLCRSRKSVTAAAHWRRTRMVGGTRQLEGIALLAHNSLSNAYCRFLLFKDRPLLNMELNEGGPIL
ncbi:hypothetical protein D3C73_1492440 [compost metagenome]